MKRIIRQRIFETNSSSTHSLIIMTQEKWDEFKTTDKWLADWDGQLYLVDDLIKKMKEAVKKYPDQYTDIDLDNRQACIEYLTSRKNSWVPADYFTYDAWGDYEWSDWAECYAEEFVTPSGDKMIAVGAYGFQG